MRDAEQLTRRLTDALSEAGVLTPGADDVTRATIRTVLLAETEPAPGRPARSRSAGGRVAEIAGYLGAALVAGALAVLFAEQWGALSTAVQIAILLGIAAVAGFSAWRVVPEPGGPRTMVRLSSALSVVAAAATAGAAGVAVDGAGAEPEWSLLAAGLVGAVVAAVGWRFAATVLGQVAVFVGVTTAALSAVGVADPEQEAWYPAVILVAAVGWLALNELRRLPGTTAVRALALVTVLVSVQSTGYTLEIRWAPYVLTLAAAAVGFLLYAGPVRSWPYVAFAVVATLLAVPEALFDLTDSHVGAAFALAVSGALVLAGAAFALRPRHHARS